MDRFLNHGERYRQAMRQLMRLIMIEKETDARHSALVLGGD
jgi:hypothetical protein